MIDPAAVAALYPSVIGCFVFSAIAVNRDIDVRVRSPRGTMDLEFTVYSPKTKRKWAHTFEWSVLDTAIDPHMMVMTKATEMANGVSGGHHD